MPGAFSGSWMRRSGWRAPRTAWCSSASVLPLRRKELELEVREGARGVGAAEASLGVGVCLPQSPEKACTGGAVHLPGGALIHLCAHSFTYPSRVLSGL